MSSEYTASQISSFLLQQLEQNEKITYQAIYYAKLSDDLEEFCNYYRDDNCDLNNALIRVFKEIKDIESAKDKYLYVSGKFVNELHVLLSGEVGFTGANGFVLPNFVVQERQYEEGKFLRINAFYGCRKIEDEDAFYMTSAEVHSVALILCKFLSEDLGQGFEELYRRQFGGEPLMKMRQMYDFLEDFLVPFYINASEQGCGLLIELSI